MESQQIMVSINPPYTNMIKEGYKTIEFRNNPILDLKKDDVLYLYETKNKSGVGSIIGFCYVEALIPIAVIGDVKDYCLKDVYTKHFKVFLNYCFANDLTVPYMAYDEFVLNVIKDMNEKYNLYRNILPNLDCSFYQHIYTDKDYGISIGEGNSKYAILLKDFVSKKMELNDFISLKSNKVLTRPPQNMCYVKEISKLKTQFGETIRCGFCGCNKEITDNDEIEYSREHCKYYCCPEHATSQYFEYEGSKPIDFDEAQTNENNLTGGWNI